MPADKPSSVFRSSFRSSSDGSLGMGKRPVIIDIMGPDLKTSILPDDLKLVLHVNPNSMKMSYSKVIERIQTKGGYVEQHFGEGTDSIAFAAATGGFMRLFTGLTNITGGGLDMGGTRRQSLAYDSYLNFLSLFFHGGHIYDRNRQIVMTGIIKITFDGHEFFGWFDDFNVTESADKPYQFELTTNFTVSHEHMTLRSLFVDNAASARAFDETGQGGSADGDQSFLRNIGVVDAAQEAVDRFEAFREQAGSSTEVEASGNGFDFGDEGVQEEPVPTDIEEGFEEFEFGG